MNEKIETIENIIKGKISLINYKREVDYKNFIWNCKNMVVYGPVLSRRLGYSLGINLFPFEKKVCNFNCLYCDCGGKKNTLSREVNKFDIYKIKKKLISSFEFHALKKTHLDYITFAGNGEPTFHPMFSEIFYYTRILRDKYFPNKPLALFSNGSMLANTKVLKTIDKFDEKIFKLDVSDENTFKYINQPDRNISFKKIVNDLSKIRNIKISSAVLSSGIKNFNSLKNFDYIEILKIINPIEIHLYSIDYPPVNRAVRRTRISKMLELAIYMAERINIKIKILQSRRAW